MKISKILIMLLYLSCFSAQATSSARADHCNTLTYSAFGGHSIPHHGTDPGSMNHIVTSEHFRLFFNKNMTSFPAQNIVVAQSLVDRMEDAFTIYINMGLRSPIDNDRYRALRDYTHSTMYKDSKFSVYIRTNLSAPSYGVTYETCPYITLNVNSLSNDTPEHEVAHLFIWGYTNLVATWLNEGISTLSEGLFNHGPFNYLSPEPNQTTIFNYGSSDYEKAADLWNTKHLNFLDEYENTNFIQYFLESLDVMDTSYDGLFFKKDINASYSRTSYSASQVIHQKIYCIAEKVLATGVAITPLTAGSSGC